MSSIMADPKLDETVKPVQREPEDKKSNSDPKCKRCRHYQSNHRRDGCIVEVGLFSHKECGCSGEW
jgi:hypothetical protein